MKTKKLVNDMFQYEIIFSIGTKEELIEFYTKLSKNKNYSDSDRIATKLREGLLTHRGFVLNMKYMRNKKTNYKVYLVTVKTDSPSLENLSEKDLIKQIKITFHHECRHVVDRIIIDRDMNFDDTEMSAIVSSHIVVELEETLYEWIENG